MISAILKSYLLLENKENFGYTSITYDGKYFYTCTKNKCIIVKIDLNGCIVDVIKVQSVYKSICFDSTEDCFWAIKNNYSQYIFKLDREFQEIDSIIFREIPYSCMHSISYKMSDDTILLYGPNFIYNVSKREGILSKHESGNNRLILSIGEIGKNLIKCTNYTLSPIIVIHMVYPNYGNSLENLNCIPNSYKPISIFPNCYDLANNTFFVSTIKNNQFTYLLKYELDDICNQVVTPEKEIKSTKYFKDDDFVCINDINIF